MCQEGVPLHLSKPNPSCTLPPLHWLMCNGINGTCRPNLEGRGGEGREERGGKGREGKEGREGEGREERGGRGGEGSAG